MTQLPDPRLALFLENCVPFVNTLNFGHPILFGPTSLQLAQIKTQLALHQLNALATGGHTVPALSLLNLLKVTMSHPLYNPRGASFSGQRPIMSSQFSMSSQPAMDVGNGRLRPSSMIPSLMSQQLGFQMNQRPAPLSQDLETTIDMHIRGAREEVRLLSELMQQQKLVDPRIRKESREEVLTQGTAFSSQRVPSRMEESVDWSIYPAPTKLFSSQVAQPSPPSQMFQPSAFGTTSAGGGRGNLESQHPLGPTQYTSESASSILASFGLSNEDLEHLSHYPDEQLTPDNLPFILRDIRLQKAKRNLSDMDHTRPSPASEHVGSESRHSKVIDYGHSSKFGYPEENADSFQLDQLPKESAAFIVESSVNSTAFPMVDPKRAESGAVSGPKKPTMDQRKRSSHTKTVKATSGRDADPKSMPASSRAVVLPPGHSTSSRSNLLSFSGGSSGPKPGYVSTKAPWSLSFSTSNNAKRLPTPTMMNDYSAASPRIFPHTCSLCNIECVQIKEWIEHQNSSVHIESCRRLRKQFPDWDVEKFPVSSSTSRDRRSPARRARSPSRSQSWSRSPSPWRYHSRSGSRGRRLCSRSRSPRRYRRSRSRSRSPRRGSRSSPLLSRRSRSPHRSRSRSRSRHSRRLSPRRSSSHRQTRSSSTEKLAKKLIESTGLSGKSNITLEAMMQSLAPALLAELSKRKGGSTSASVKSSSKKSSSPPSAFKKNEASKYSSAYKAVHASAAKPSSSTEEKSISSNSKNVKVKKKMGSGTGCLLRFKGVPFATTHQEFMKALQPYGKVSQAILMKKIEEASVYMEREEDAKALANCNSFKIHGRLISIVVESSKEAPKEPKKQVVKKKEVTATKSPVKAKALGKGTGAGVVKKMIKKNPTQELLTKYVVELTGLPEAGYTVEDLAKIASPFGTPSEVTISVTHRKALMGLPGQEALVNMVNACKDVPVKIQEQQLSVAALTKPVDLRSVESLFRVFMGIEKPAEDDGLADRILVVSNVPSGSSGTTDVQELVKRFGAVKQALVLNYRILFEMDSPSAAKAVFNRFQKFPCIIQNYPLTFSLITPMNSSEEVKKKTEGKSPKIATKSSDQAKKDSMSTKCAPAVNKVKVVKSQANTLTSVKEKSAVTSSMVKNTAPLKPSDRTSTASLPKSDPESTPAASVSVSTDVSTAVVAEDVSSSAVSHGTPLETSSTAGTQETNAMVVPSSAEEGGVGKILPDSIESRQAVFPDSTKESTTCMAVSEEQSKEVKVDTALCADAPTAESVAELQETQTDSVSDEPKQATGIKLDDGTVEVSTDLQASGTESEVLKPDCPAPTVLSVSSVRDEITGGKSSDPTPLSTEPKHAAESEPILPSGILSPSQPQSDLAAVNGTQPPKKPQPAKKGLTPEPVPSSKGEDKLGFPPVTPEILRALEAAVQECRMRASMQAKSSVSTPPTEKGARQPVDKTDLSKRSTERDRPPKAKAQAQSDEEQPPVTCRGGSGSSSGSRRSKGDDGPTSRKGRGHEEEGRQKSHGSLRSPKVSRSSPKARDVKPVEEDFTEESFPFDLDEFVTVDEVGDEVDMIPMKEEQSPSAPDMMPPAKRMRVQESVKGQQRQQQESSKGQAQKKPTTSASKLTKKPVVGSKAKPVKKPPPKPVHPKMDPVTGGTASEISVETMEVEEESDKCVPKVQEEEREHTDVEPVKALESQKEAVPEFLTENEAEKSKMIVPDEDQKCKRESGQTVSMQDGSSFLVQAECSAPAVDVPQNTPRGHSETGEIPQEVKELTEEKLQAELEGQGAGTALVTLDEVSEEEEDYPEEDEMLGLAGGQDDPDTLVTVDEVGGDEDPYLQAVRELQALVTLDEIVEEEDGNEEVSAERFPFGMDDDSGEVFSAEALVTLDETQGDEEIEEEGGKETNTETMAFQFLNATAESTGAAESPGPEELRKMNFVTVDEVGEEEEPTAEEEEAQLSARRGDGVPKQRTRPSPAVRRSARGKKDVCVKAEMVEASETPQTNPVKSCSTEQASSSPEPGYGLELPRIKCEVPDDMPISDPSAEKQEQKVLESPAVKQEPADPYHGMETHNAGKESNIGRDEMIQQQPEVKQSPSLTDFKLPPFSPDQPIGMEFVVPKTGFFCRLCLLFYGSEETAKKTHCSTLKHYQNLERYMMKMRTQQSREPAQSPVPD